jgi:hypothetical protein
MMRKLRNVKMSLTKFPKVLIISVSIHLKKLTLFIAIDEALVIIKSLNDDSKFGEEDLLDVVKDPKVLARRRITES